jgi:O-acetyl-ADP-ribose deacetylase (regulator of RNase III)
MITQNKINYISGNILETQYDVIAHGVNCKGVFGAGLAKEIRDKWPEVYNNYMDKFLRLGWRLGEIQMVHVGLEPNPEKKLIVNMAIQENYVRDPKKVYVDYSAVAVCLDKLFKYCKEHSLSCAIPKIGCGLANGDWKTIGHIIAKTYKENRIPLNIYSF